MRASMCIYIYIYPYFDATKIKQKHIFQYVINYMFFSISVLKFVCVFWINGIFTLLK